MNPDSFSHTAAAHQVSAQAFGIALEILEDRGIDATPLFAGLSFDRAHVQHLRARVPWDEFSIFLERFEAAVGSDVYATLHERFYRRNEYGPFRHVLRLAVSPHMGFQALTRWFGPYWFPMVHVSLTWPATNRGCMHMAIPERLRDSPQFFRMNRVAFESTARLLGDQTGRVELELHPREAYFHIHVAPSRTLWSLPGRLRSWVHPDTRVIETLSEQQEELRLTLQALRDSELRYRQLIEQSRAGIWRLEAGADHLSFASPAVKDQLGYAPDELRDLPIEKYIVPEDHPKVEELLTAAAAPDNNAIVVREIRHLHKDGHVVWCEVHAAPIRDERGQVVAIQGVTHDITARKEIEWERERTRAAERARDRAEGANRLKSSILASMSHEIRTPLTSQLGFTELMLRELQGTPHEQSLRIIQRSGRRLLTLLNNMLELARLEANEVPVEPVDYPVVLTIRQVVELLHLQAEEKGLALRVTVPDDLMVCSDPRRDEQVLLNVIGNAIRYTREGAVTIKGRPLISDGGKAWTEIRVSDTGIGIAADFLPFVFEEFRQEHPQVNRDPREGKGGTGLGLAITRRLMTGIGGRVFIESEKDVGTTVILQFPAPIDGVTSPAGRTGPGQPDQDFHPSR